MREQVRRRMLRWFARRGLLDPDDARGMLDWDNGGGKWGQFCLLNIKLGRAGAYCVPTQYLEWWA